MSARLRDLARNLATTAASLLVLALAGEAALRLAGFVPDQWRNRAHLVKGKAALLDCYPTNPRGYFPLDLRDPATREHYRAAFGMDLEALAPISPWAVETRFNTDHFRDVERAPRRPGVKRVVIIGDSFTVGQGVREPDTYPRVLERLLNTAEPGGWEVRNCAQRGLDFPGLQDLFERVLDYEPDVLVFGMVLNDVEQSPGFDAAYPFVNDWILDRGREAGDAPPSSFGFLRSRAAAFVGDRIDAFRIARETTRWYLDMYGEPNREGWERTEQHLKSMKRKTRDRGGRFLVALWPLLVDLEGAYPFAAVHAKVGAFCASAGIPFSDLLPLLEGRTAASLWVHPVDRHPNEIAHLRTAVGLLPVVRELASRKARWTSDGDTE